MKKNLHILPILFLLATFGFFHSCGFNANAIKGNGTLVTEKFDAPLISHIEISGMYHVVLTDHDLGGILIETDENILEYIQVEITDSKLTLSMTEKQMYRPTKLEVRIPVHKLEKIVVSGAAKIEGDHRINSDNLLVDLSGATDVSLEVFAMQLTTQVSGAGSIHLKGSSRKHYVDLSGAANLRAIDLITENTHISLSGAGSAHVHATEHLNASLSGVGSIRYAGSPNQKQVNRSGIGTISAMN